MKPPSQWLQKFTDADRRVHRNAVNVAGGVKLSPSRYLAANPLRPGEALIVRFAVSRSTGVFAHAVALSAEAPARLFDSGKHTVFQVDSPDVGGRTEQFIRTQYAVNGERVRWRLHRVTASVVS